uniref:Uncharacterized protein n=1 Tax=Aegilops tauschii subsp. strangulata TaxID=200361 RepID=A0A453HB57_AEGTS
MKCSGEISSSHSRTILAPSARIFSAMLSASSLGTPALSTAGAFSTSSLASFRPKLVIALSSLIILSFAAASNPSSFTSNAIFSSLGFASSAAPAPSPASGAAPPMRMARGGSWSTPRRPRRASAREEASMRLRPQISSTRPETRGVGVTAVENAAAQDGRAAGRRRRRWRRRVAIRVLVGQQKQRGSGD